MNSLKQRWEKFRSQTTRGNLVRSNSFTLQLSPTFFKDSRLRHNNNNNSGHRKNSSSSSCSTEDSPSLLSPAKQQKVRYIFSSKLRRRPSCLSMLQESLRDIYLGYMTRNSSVPGLVEILPDGLRVQYARYDGTDIEEFFNPFQTIAYWTAVQCVVRPHTSPDGQSGINIGFFPFSKNGQWLVQGREDRTSSDSTFSWLAGDDQTLSLLQTEHPPLFACVMRQNGASGGLRCHVFICTSAQQAIALASGLHNIVRSNQNISPRRSCKGSKESCSGRSPKDRRSVKRQNRLSASRKRRGSNAQCSMCHTQTPPECSTSFVQLMAGLRQLGIRDLVPSPDCHDRRKFRRSSSPKPTRRQNFVMKSKKTGSSHKYHVIQDSPEPPVPPSKPHWMKLLMSLSLRNAGGQSRKSLFNLSQSSAALRQKAQMAVVLSNRGKWLSRRSGMGSMPLLACSCRPDSEGHESRFTSVSLRQTADTTRGRGSMRKSEGAYAEIQEPGFGCKQCKRKGSEVLSVSENNLFNRQILFSEVPCTIGLDAKLDDDEDEDSYGLCPHMANPKLAFRRLPAREESVKNPYKCTGKCGWNMAKPQTSVKDDSALLKKDAEIVSILEQIANSTATQVDRELQDSTSPVDNENDQQQDDNCINNKGWGCSTFLP